MSEENEQGKKPKHEPGDLVPRKGYFEVCPNCEKEFFGRRNQKYCDGRCRVQFNNHLRNELKVPRTIREMKKADRILRRLFYQFPKVPIFEELLRSHGFPWLIPFHPIETGFGIMEGYLSFAILRDSEEGTIAIYPIKEANELELEFLFEEIDLDL